mmetsp:Transcript_2261/g.4663  ORF Transcript_2261/g.4663 Transcript_2261/m.4663 type:complete len:139 (-) Transcript_2261:69-485(-)
MTCEGQHGFPSLTVASWQHHGFMQALVAHDSFSGSGSSIKSNKRPFDDDDLSIPAAQSKHDLDEGVIMMIAALEACDFSRTDAQTAGDSLLVSSMNGDSIVEPVRRITNREPPRRFRRRVALWASMTRRMLRLAQDHH